jgi:hypothetical protein
LIKIIENSWKIKNVINYISSVFMFFLNSININISERKSFTYSEFILSQVKKKIESLELEEI